MSPLRFLGTARPIDNPRAVLAVFDRAPTDDELRKLHDVLRAVASPPPPEPLGAVRTSWLRRFTSGRNRGDAQ